MAKQGQMGGGALKDMVVVCSVVVREGEDVSLKNC